MQSVKHPPLPTLKHIFFHKITRFLYCLFTVLLVFLYSHAEACMGTPVPPCGRSVFLAKFTPGVVVFPPAGGAINVPIGVLPFANWNTQGLPNAPVCPQPTAATLTLTLTCLPSGTVIGPLAFPVPVPTVPGAQPLGGPVNFVIPAGTFPAGTPPQICLVVGTYFVTFSDNVTLVFNGDTEVCIVPPSPLDMTTPQLDMQYISPDGTNYRTCRRGDQANFYFLIANNDPELSVTLDLNSIGRQVAQLPQGFTSANAYANDVYSISLPEDDTDTFAAAFGDELTPGELLKEPDPSVPNNQALNRSFSLQPCEAIIICITMRSYGMCANGSCNERLLKVEGQFSDGSPALACASTLYVVDESSAKSVLCEVIDSVKVNPEGMAIWSPADYGDANGPFPHASTFAVGNQPTGGFLTEGEFVTGLFPSSASDYTRIDGIPMGMNYFVNFNSPQCGDGQNQVSVMGLDVPRTEPISIPAIIFQGITSPLEIQMDLIQDQLVILAQGDFLYNGPINPFFVDPPPNFCIDPSICRVITKRFDQSRKSISSEPNAISRLFAVPSNDSACDTLNIFDNTATLAPWTAMVNGDGISLSSSSGTGMLEYCYNAISSLPKVPATTISYIDVNCQGALSPLLVPIAIRVKDTTRVSIKNALEPVSFILNSSTPNPFREHTRINYELQKAALLDLVIFNSQGQIVRTLVSSKRVDSGKYAIPWDGRSDGGGLLPNGVYICRLKVGNTQMTERIALIY